MTVSEYNHHHHHHHGMDPMSPTNARSFHSRHHGRSQSRSWSRSRYPREPYPSKSYRSVSPRDPSPQRRRASHHRRMSRSRSRSYSRSPRRYRPSRSSPSSRRRNDAPARFPNPSPCCVLGIFGLSNRTRESDLRDLIEQYVPVKEVTIVYDLKTGASRRFGFATFETVEDAARVREKLNGVELHERCMRVDYSMTSRAHSPTPGEYRGRKPSYRDRYESRSGRYYSPRPSSRERHSSRERFSRRSSRYD